SDVMPMDCCRRADTIDKPRLDLTTLFDANFGSGHRSAVAPNGRGALRQELSLAWSGFERDEIVRRLGAQWAGKQQMSAKAGQSTNHTTTRHRGAIRRFESHLSSAPPHHVPAASLPCSEVLQMCASDAWYREQIRDERNANRLAEPEVMPQRRGTIRIGVG